MRNTEKVSGMGKNSTQKGKKNPEKRRRGSRTAAGILAILTGAIGIHKFYQGQWVQGLISVLFFWTGIPAILGVIEGARLLGSDEDEGTGASLPEKQEVPQTE